MRTAISIIVLIAILGCQVEQPPVYDFAAVLEHIDRIDAAQGTSFFNESILTVLDKETIDVLLVDIEELRRYNSDMKMARDHDAIVLLLDSRESLLESQKLYLQFEETFDGKYDCSQRGRDLLGLKYLDAAVEKGIHANARLDKLVAEHKVANELIFQRPRPVLWDSDYGVISLESRMYKENLEDLCGTVS